MIYAVIDTNVIVSALLTHNPMVATAKVLEQPEALPRYSESHFPCRNGSHH